MVRELDALTDGEGRIRAHASRRLLDAEQGAIFR